MTPIKSNRAPLTKRISALAVTLAAALAFAAFSPNAQAQTPKPSKELVALADALNFLYPNQNVNVANANTTQLSSAVAQAISVNPTLKPGNIAGEALKNAGSNAQDAGDEIGEKARTAAPSVDGFIIARDAIKRAGSGKTLNVSLVPDFATEFVSSQTQAFALAKAVLKTKPGAGAVIGGFASELTTLADQTALTNNALIKSNGISAAAQDIVKWVVVEVDEDGNNTADFTNSIAGSNVTLASKIGTGGVAGDPTNAGNIVDKLLFNGALPKLKSGAASFIKSVGKVADLEQLSRIAAAVGNQVNVVAGKSTAIKLAAANGIVKSLAKAVMAKGTTPPTPAVAPNTSPDYSFTNKQDEIAEVAAYMVAKILNNTTIVGATGVKAQITAKNGGAKIMAIIKSAVSVAKGKKVATAAGSTYFLNVAQDVTGSVAETLGELKQAADLAANTTVAATIQAIKDYLALKSSQIAGKANAAMLTTLIDTEYLPIASTRFEDGTIIIPNLNPDPFAESDYRPF